MQILQEHRAGMQGHTFAQQVGKALHIPSGRSSVSYSRLSVGALRDPRGRC